MTESRTLEERIARLEAIVAGLEGEDLELQDALALFAEGVEHLRESERQLRSSELRIERLLQGPDGDVVAHPIPERDE